MMAQKSKEQEEDESEFTSISVSQKNLEKLNRLKRKLENYHNHNLRMDRLITNLIDNYSKIKTPNLDMI